MLVSHFWKNRVEKEISALKRVSNAEKKIEKEKAALKKVSNAKKKEKKKNVKKNK